MAGYFTESNYENAVLQLLNEELGYNYVYGPDVERDYHSPLYEDVLLPSLQRINKSDNPWQRDFYRLFCVPWL